MGFFGGLWDGIKGAATGFLTGGPAGAIAGGLGGVAKNIFKGKGAGSKIQDILGMAPGVIGGIDGYRTSRDAEKRRNQIMDMVRGYSEGMLQDAEPLRKRANAGMMARADRLESMVGTPDTSGLRDSANPFRRNFSFDLSAPTAAAAVPPPPSGATSSPPPSRPAQNREVPVSRSSGRGGPSRGSSGVVKPNRRRQRRLALLPGPGRYD